MTVYRAVSALVFTMILAAAPVFAQAVFSGVVLDPNGAPVEGVTIYLTNVATASQLDFPTTAQGRFEFSGLPAGEYRVTSTPSVGAFMVMLAPGQPLYREIKLAFGPFEEIWDVVRANPVSGPAALRNMPAGWRCITRVTGVPLCAPSSIIDEFERDEVERLKSPVLGPRRIGLQPVYPQPLLEAGVQGTVVMRGRLSAEGALTGVEVVSSDHRDLTASALESVAAVSWEPARIRGVAQAVPLTLTIRYRLDPLSPVPARSPAGQPTDTPVAAPRGIVQSAARQAAPPQTVAQPLVFEVASVKPNNSGAPMVSMRNLPGGGFQAINQTLRGLIQFAYGIRAFQLVGPSWIDDARFDVTASAGRPLMPGELQAMLRATLAERFKLVVRTETQELPVYNLVVARADGRLGPGLRPANATNCAPVVPGQPMAMAPGQAPPCGTMGGGRGGPFTARSVSMDALAGNFSNQVNRPVINRTGLMGLFDLELEFAGGRGGGGLGPLPPQPGEPPPPPDDRPVLTTAVQEQLGLRLDNARGPVAITRIESVSQPTPD